MCNRDDLQVPEDPKFTRRSWTLERVGWGFLGIIVGAALLGLLGPGPLSDAVARAEDGSLEVVYERFGRLDTETTLRVRVSPGCEILFDRDYWTRLRVDGITPEPERVAGDASAVRYAFHPSTAEVVFDVTFRQAGKLRGGVRTPGGPRLSLGHFVFP